MINPQRPGGRGDKGWNSSPENTVTTYLSTPPIVQILQHLFGIQITAEILVTARGQLHVQTHKMNCL